MNKFFFLSVILLIASTAFSQFSTAKNLFIYDRQFNYGWHSGATNIISSTCYFYYNDTTAYYLQIPDRNRKKSFDNDGETNNVLLADTLNRLYIDLTNSMSYSLNSNKLHNGIYGDSVYNMKWVLTNDTKIVDSMICEKAICSFRGRNYIAWYTSKIILPFGPYKFGGLPGLIVELYDEEKNDHYFLRKVESSNMHYPYFNNKPYLSRKVWIREELALRAKLVEASQAANNEGNCIDCRGTTELIFNDWEKLED